MLRRFNSLIKGPKGHASDEELSELHLSLRPALSVDSSLFSSAQHHHVNPLQQQLALAREKGLARARRPSDNGQTSVMNGASRQQQMNEGFVIARVPEEKSWKEGYEHGILNLPLDSPEKKPSEPSRDREENGAAAASVDDDSQFTFCSVVVPTQQPEAPRVLRTSNSDAVAAASQNAQVGSDMHTVVDIPDAHTGSGVDLETVRRSGLTVGPGRTISSWSTDSAAEHCRICQQYSDEPLIELGCLCRGEMAKSHRSCIETWFKNKGTNKCEVCQHVASNISAPATSLAQPHFWVWRLGGPYGIDATHASQNQPGGRSDSRVGFQSAPLVSRPVLLMIIRKHPLIPVMWLGLLGFMTYLFIDAINTSTIGYAAMPIGFLFGVLVVLGLGTAVRLVLEYLHERNMRRRIQLLELDPVNEDPAEGSVSPESSDHPTTTRTQYGPAAV